MLDSFDDLVINYSAGALMRCVIILEIMSNEDVRVCVRVSFFSCRSCCHCATIDSADENPQVIFERVTLLS